jgi:hypothetical protein
MPSHDQDQGRAALISLASSASVKDRLRLLPLIDPPFVFSSPLAEPYAYSRYGRIRFHLGPSDSPQFVRPS